MITSKVSVIIAVNQPMSHGAATIQSVINQSYKNWELLVVNDGSTDDTAQVVAQCNDARIRYLDQPNKGLPAARNTGIANSSGEYIAFLDADDLYHPEKLAIQVAHLAQNPTLGLSYTSRIGIDERGTLLHFYRAPTKTTLKEIVLGLPFTINDLLVRRHWVEQVGGFDETFRLNSEDRDFYVRLVLAGCQLAGLAHCLTYRRFHAGRVFNNVPAKMAQYVRALETAFADPRCPEEVRAVRDEAYAEVYKVWSCQMLMQGEVALAGQYLAALRALNPDFLQGNAQEKYITDLAAASTREGGDHEALLHNAFASLPPDLRDWTKLRGWTIARGYLERGVRDLLWGRSEQGRAHCAHAQHLGAKFDRRLRDMLVDQLLNYEFEYGPEDAQLAVLRLSHVLNWPAVHNDVRRLLASYAITQAFQSYRMGDYRNTLNDIFQALAYDRHHMVNRGLWAIGVRSMLKLATN